VASRWAPHPQSAPPFCLEWQTPEGVLGPSASQSRWSERTQAPLKHFPTSLRSGKTHVDDILIAFTPLTSALVSRRSPADAHQPALTNRPFLGYDVPSASKGRSLDNITLVATAPIGQFSVGLVLTSELGQLGLFPKPWHRKQQPKEGFPILIYYLDLALFWRLSKFSSALDLLTDIVQCFQCLR